MTEADKRRPGAAALTGAFNFRDLGGLPTALHAHRPPARVLS
jgi:hypothetical protein